MSRKRKAVSFLYGKNQSAVRRNSGFPTCCFAQSVFVNLAVAGNHGPIGFFYFYGLCLVAAVEYQLYFLILLYYYSVLILKALI